MAGPTAKQFEAQVDQWVRDVPGKLEAFARQVCYETAFRVVQATPVVVGFLRGSWQPSIGAPQAVPTASADASGAKAMASVGLVIANLKLGDTFHMFNNAAYALRVEFGFVGDDSLGRTYNQQGRFYVTGTLASWQDICTHVANDLKGKA